MQAHSPGQASEPLRRRPVWGRIGLLGAGAAVGLLVGLGVLTIDGRSDDPIALVVEPDQVNDSPTRTVSGVAVDPETRKPLPHVVVVFTDGFGCTSRTVTNERGEWWFETSADVTGLGGNYSIAVIDEAASLETDAPVGTACSDPGRVGHDEASAPSAGRSGRSLA